LKDDPALSATLQKRIVANSTEKTAADMKPYRRGIPGSSAAFEMVPIPPGEFEMAPGRRVKVAPFWMGKHEVTWDEYRLFMFHQAAGAEPEVDAVSHPTRPYVEMSFGMGIDGYPAISMTQHAANKFAQWLSAKTGHFYRLPTEAEWQYACRAGGEGKLPQPLQDYAWYADNSNGKYQQVGKRKPNAFGLHDMIGNVMEWTLDQHAPLSPGQFDNPWVKASQPYPHAVLGGSWNDPAEGLGCSARVGSDPSWKMQDPQLPKSIWYHTDAQFLGFRVVRPLKIPTAAEMHAYWNNGVEQEP
jgi:formylglycine-generating enzyme required for sulfatase activity